MAAIIPPNCRATLYPDGIPILEESKMEKIIRDEGVDVVRLLLQRYHP